MDEHGPLIVTCQIQNGDNLYVIFELLQGITCGQRLEFPGWMPINPEEFLGYPQMGRLQAYHTCIYIPAYNTWTSWCCVDGGVPY